MIYLPHHFQISNNFGSSHIKISRSSDGEQKQRQQVCAVPRLRFNVAVKRQPRGQQQDRHGGHDIAGSRQLRGNPVDAQVRGSRQEDRQSRCRQRRSERKDNQGAAAGGGGTQGNVKTRNGWKKFLKGFYKKLFIGLWIVGFTGWGDPEG